MFEGYYADTCAEKFPLTLMGGWAECPAVRTRERGPPSASAEMLIIAEEHKLEEFKKVILQKIWMKKAIFMENEDFMNKLKETPSILIDFFKL